MAATKRLSEVDHTPGWRLNINGVEVLGEWSVRSPFGTIHSSVVVDNTGKPVFDRPTYRESPHVNCIVWGVMEDGTARFAVIRQPRPHADDPEQPGDTHLAVVFGQTPMGFLEKVIGKELLLRYETVEQGAAREAHEEAGAKIVLEVERPQYPWHNPNPTFVATWAELVFVKIDLSKLEELKVDHHEPIFSAEYITAEELIRRITAGKDEAGAVYRGCTSLSSWMIFFATHPEYFPK